MLSLSMHLASIISLSKHNPSLILFSCSNSESSLVFSSDKFRFSSSNYFFMKFFFSASTSFMLRSPFRWGGRSVVINMKSNSIIALQSGDFCNGQVVVLFEVSSQWRRLIRHIPASFLIDPKTSITWSSKIGCSVAMKN